MKESKETIFKIGTEGGSLMISKIEINGEVTFVCTQGEIDFKGEGLDVHKKEEYSTIEEAIRRMDKYSWPMFYVLQIHPDFRDIIKIKLIEKLNNDKRMTEEKKHWMSSIEEALNIQLKYAETSGWSFTDQ